MSVTKAEKNTLVITADGELDHHTAAKIRKEADNAFSGDTRNIIFDFSKLTFMDSSGLGMIMGRYKKIQKKGGSLVIVSPKPQVKRILEMSGIMSIAKIEPNIKQALKRM
ncbi:MAG: anti-sigma F factor antagonist [Clostridia bacterium]|nr:anti-sigma F factor antagonist [Clostridia bacterium]